jgi:ABC-type Fe3+-hydroxamate transport system substrate-binding protein
MTRFLLPILAATFTLAACADATSDAASTSSASAQVTKANRPEVTLTSGTNPAILDGPDHLTVIALQPNVTAKVVEESLAYCTVTVVPGDATQTKFDITIDYELDDGFNGCEIAFDDGAGYHADIEIGFSIDD